MVSFNFFTQARGPEVDIDLFPRARQMGAQTGNLIKTPLQAGIEGAIEGLSTGFDLVGKYQQNQIRQNQIEQLPVTNQNNAAIARQNEAEASIKENAAYISEQTQDAQLQATKVKLEKEANDIKIQNDFTDSFTSATTPDQRIAIISDPKYAGLFAKNPNLYKQAISNPGVYPYLNDQEKEAADLQFRRATTSNAYDKEALERQQAFQAASVAVEQDPLTNQLQDKLDTTPDKYPDNVEFVPSGRYSITDGNVELDKYGQKVLNPRFDTTLKDQWDVLDKTGKLLATSVPEKSRQAYLNYLKEKAYQDGTFKNRALSSLQPKKSTSSPEEIKRREDSFTRNSQINPSVSIKEEYDPVRFQLQKTLNLSEEGLKALSPQISSIKTQITKYLNAPDERASVDAVQSMNNTVASIARTVADTEFQSNPALRAQYTTSHVAEYNKSIQEAVNTNPLGFIVSADVKADLTAAYKVDSPEDLYYVKRRDLLESQMNQVISKILASEYAKKTQSVRSQAATKNLNSIFLKAANGGVNPTK